MPGRTCTLLLRHWYDREIDFLESGSRGLGGWPKGNVVNLPLYRACSEAQCAVSVVSGGE